MLQLRLFGVEEPCQPSGVGHPCGGRWGWRGQTWRKIEKFGVPKHSKFPKCCCFIVFLGWIFTYIPRHLPCLQCQVFLSLTFLAGKVDMAKIICEAVPILSRLKLPCFKGYVVQAQLGPRLVAGDHGLSCRYLQWVQERWQARTFLHDGNKKQQIWGWPSRKFVNKTGESSINAYLNIVLSYIFCSVFSPRIRVPSLGVSTDGVNRWFFVNRFRFQSFI